jgi:hypothetical protein
LARCCASSSLPATNAKRFAQGSASDAAIRSGAVEANAEHVPELRPRDHSTTTVANVTALVAGGYHAHAASDPITASARSFRTSLRSRIATCRQNRPTRSQRTRDRTTRRQIEMLAQHLSRVPPLFFIVLTCRHLCGIAGEGKSIPRDERRIDLKQSCSAEGTIADDPPLTSCPPSTTDPSLCAMRRNELLKEAID